MSDLTITVALEGQGEVEQVVLEDQGPEEDWVTRSTHLNSSVATLGRGKLLSLGQCRGLGFEYKIKVASFCT